MLVFFKIIISIQWYVSNRTKNLNDFQTRAWSFGNRIKQCGRESMTVCFLEGNSDPCSISLHKLSYVKMNSPLLLCYFTARKVVKIMMVSKRRKQQYNSFPTSPFPCTRNSSKKILLLHIQNPVPSKIQTHYPNINKDSASGIRRWNRYNECSGWRTNNALEVKHLLVSTAYPIFREETHWTYSHTWKAGTG